MKNIPYAAQSIEDDDVAAVAQALKAPYLTQGPLVGRFEQAVAAYCDAKYAVALNSGTSALHAACFAAGINNGAEAITSPITFVATANAVLYCGGRPVFADVQAGTINIDPAQIAARIKKKTRAILPVHFAGQPCEMEKISRLAKKHRLTVIEDACHALGAEYNGKKVGSCRYSDMTVVSFHAVKHITTGEGGMVLTNRLDLYKKMLMFRTHGITRETSAEGAWYYEMRFLGYNYRITDFQCALGNSQLKKLDRFVARRREIAARYHAAFGKMAGVTTLDEKPGCRSAWHIYPIMVKADRRKVFDKLRRSGIGVNVHYLPVYLQPYYQEMGYKKGQCPQAERYYEKAITLPLYPKMTDRDIEAVIKAVGDAL
ncbi:UDP-4-amino-4,6-dideoxy-N-acetyl-beta-L-altrosamine transaminase [Candidatus Saganbacteria bacterium]|nr:UDP-4-amino-4,6-dideoxy-N-acetyl-beta-L-altrosamine transaminase [Candidatus Saganbacteria bacterium]